MRTAQPGGESVAVLPGDGRGVEVGDVQREAVRLLDARLLQRVRQQQLVGDPAGVARVDVHRRAAPGLERPYRLGQQPQALLRGLAGQAARGPLGDGVGLQHHPGPVLADALRGAGDPGPVGVGVRRAAGGVLAAVAVRDVVGHEHGDAGGALGLLGDVGDLLLRVVARHPHRGRLLGDAPHRLGVAVAAPLLPGSCLPGGPAARLDPERGVRAGAGIAGDRRARAGRQAHGSRAHQDDGAAPGEAGRADPGHERHLFPLDPDGHTSVKYVASSGRDFLLRTGRRCSGRRPRGSSAGHPPPSTRARS